MKLYNISKDEAKMLIQQFESIEKLGLALWNTGKAASIEEGIKKAKRIKNFANKS